MYFLCANSAQAFFAATIYFLLLYNYALARITKYIRTWSDIWIVRPNPMAIVVDPADIPGLKFKIDQYYTFASKFYELSAAGEVISGWMKLWQLEVIVSRCWYEVHSVPNALVLDVTVTYIVITNNANYILLSIFGCCKN